MTSMDQFALLTGIDEDLILDAVPVAWMTGEAPTTKSRRLAKAYDRFMSSGVAAAVLSAVVALGVLIGMVLLMQKGGTEEPPVGGVLESERGSDEILSETEALPETEETETADPAVPAEEVWLVKDGEAELVMETREDEMHMDEIARAADKIYEATGARVDLVDANAPVDYALTLHFQRDTSFPYDSEGYRITFDGSAILVCANNLPGYMAAMDRLIADATVEGGLRLPVNYRAEHIPEEETRPDYGDFTQEELLRRLGDQYLYEQFPELRDMDPDDLLYNDFPSILEDGIYYLTYTYRLHGMPTSESYRITVRREGNTFVFVEKRAPSQVISATYGDLVTPERIEAVSEEFRALYGMDPLTSGSVSLEIKDGQLLLTGEIIVSITPPEGMESMGDGCGIDHEHVFVNLVVYPYDASPVQATGA